MGATRSFEAPQLARLVRVLFCEASGGRARADALTPSPVQVLLSPTPR